MLYSDSSLKWKFIEWLYEQVINRSKNAEYGEWYLFNNHADIARRLNGFTKTFSGLKVDASIYDDKFFSMQTLLQGNSGL